MIEIIILSIKQCEKWQLSFQQKIFYNKETTRQQKNVIKTFSLEIVLVILCIFI